MNSHKVTPSNPSKHKNLPIISESFYENVNQESFPWPLSPKTSDLGYNELIGTSSKNLTIQFQMKTQNLAPNRSPLHHPSPNLSPQLSLCPIQVSKPIPQSTLLFLKNLKVNRLQVPEGVSLREKAQIYFKEYKQLYEENKRLNREFISVIQKKNELAEILIHRKKLNESAGGKVKRKRRYAFQIRRQFNCPISECGKCYGTEGSLNQHVKIKHFEYFKSGEYDVYVNELIKGKGQETESI